MPDPGGALDQLALITQAVTYIHQLEAPYRAKQLGHLAALATLI